MARKEMDVTDWLADRVYALDFHAAPDVRALLAFGLLAEIKMVCESTLGRCETILQRRIIQTFDQKPASLREIGVLFCSYRTT